MDGSAAAGALIDAFGRAMEWLDRIGDTFTLLAIVAGCIVAGIVLGYLGQTGYGWRGRLYGAAIGGMIANLAAKFEEASFLVAMVLMGVVTALAFFIGAGTGLALFRGAVRADRKRESGVD